MMTLMMNEPQFTAADAPPADVAPDDRLEKRWYVVQAYAGYEKQVQNLMREHIERSDLQDHFGKILVPTEEVVEMKSGQKRTSERKFFPGYVLVQMHMTDEAWHLIRNVPKVSGFIGGTENRPMPIKNSEAEEIIQQMTDSADKPKMKFTFAPGELVRIIDGPFAEFNGTVEDVNFEKAKLRVSVTILGRSTPVELDFMHVAKG